MLQTTKTKAKCSVNIAVKKAGAGKNHPGEHHEKTVLSGTNFRLTQYFFSAIPNFIKDSDQLH